MNQHLISLLKLKLAEPLPGYKSHKMVMEHRKPAGAALKNGLEPRRSAVLIHLYQHLGDLHIVYIQRPEYDGVHSKQISFPGGKAEVGDKSILETALREAKEEVNIESSKIEILGALTELYIPPSNFLVQPFVSFQQGRPSFIPDDREVGQIIEVRLSSLINQDLSDFNVMNKSSTISVKGFLIEGQVLWGASAMMTRELLDVCSNL
jgi:8-oxo-dGTP pyrophosphatase MutT (NUDIX family)